MMEGRDYYAIDTVFPNICGFIDRVTEYTKSPMMTKAHEMYSLLISRVVSSGCKGGWTSGKIEGN